MRSYERPAGVGRKESLLIDTDHGKAGQGGASWRQDLRFDFIQDALKDIPWGRPLYVMEEVDSTNAELLRMAAGNGEGNVAPEGTLVVADRQTAGRGRNRRKWFNPSGVNIAMSWLLRPELTPQALSSVVMPISLGVCRALRKATGLDLTIKWPNDIVYQDRKVCGILCESRLTGSSVDTLVAGVGINVNMLHFPQDIVDTAISLLAMTGRTFPRDELLGEVLRCCHRCYEDYFYQGRREEIWRDYCEMSATLGRRVTVTESAGAMEGVVEAIDHSAVLYLRTDEGLLIPFVAGEVSLRPVEK